MLFVRWGYVPAFKPKSWQSLPVSDYENYKEVSVLNIDYLAEDMNMKPEALIRESIETFLRRKLKIVEAELFLLAKKYGVSSVVEFDEMVKSAGVGPS
jgi:predicted nucleic-acid-binding protein